MYDGAEAVSGRVELTIAGHRDLDQDGLEADSLLPQGRAGSAELARRELSDLWGVRGGKQHPGKRHLALGQVYNSKYQTLQQFERKEAGHFSIPSLETGTQRRQKS